MCSSYLLNCLGSHDTAKCDNTDTLLNDLEKDNTTETKVEE